MDDDIAERSYTLRPAPPKPFMVRLVIATGLVSTEKQANYLLLGVAIVGFVMAGIMLYAGSGSTKGLSQTDIQRITQLQEQGGTYAQ